MYRTFVLVSLVIYFPIASVGQSIDYAMSFNVGFDGREVKILKYSGKLQINNSLSSFFALELGNSQSHSQDDLASAIDTLWRIYKNTVSNEILVEDYLFNNLRSLFYADSIHPTTWTIHNQAKKIDTLMCIKATTTFRGRYYTAWFSKQLPAGHGPWKFGGLPGLICELLEDQGDLSIKITSVTQDIPTFPYPTKTPKTLEEFKAMGRKFIQRLEAARRATENCSTCGAQTVIRFKFWENLFE